MSLARADILTAFGVSEADVAAVGDGYEEASASAARDRARFAERIAAKAERIAEDLAAGRFMTALEASATLEYEMGSLLWLVDEP